MKEKELPIDENKMKDVVSNNVIVYNNIELPIELNDALDLLKLDLNQKTARTQVRGAIKQLQVYKNNIEATRVLINKKIEEFIKDKINNKAAEIKAPVVDVIEKLQKALDIAEAEEKRVKQLEAEKRQNLILHRTKLLLERGFIETNGEYRLIIEDDQLTFTIPVIAVPSKKEEDFSKLISEVNTAKALFVEREKVRKKIEEDKKRQKEKEEEELREKIKKQQEQIKKQNEEAGKLRYDALLSLAAGITIESNTIRFNGSYVVYFDTSINNPAEYLGSIDQEKFLYYKETLLNYLKEEDEKAKRVLEENAKKEQIAKRVSEILHKCSEYVPYLSAQSNGTQIVFSFHDGEKVVAEKKIQITTEHSELIDANVHLYIKDAINLKQKHEYKKRAFQLFADRKPSFIQMGLVYDNLLKQFIFHLTADEKINVCNGTDILIEDESAYTDFYNNTVARVEDLKKKKQIIENESLTENERVKAYLDSLLAIEAPSVNSILNKKRIKDVILIINEKISSLTKNK